MKQAIKYILMLSVLALCTHVVWGQQYVTLNQCRQLATKSTLLFKMA